MTVWNYMQWPTWIQWIEAVFSFIIPYSLFKLFMKLKQEQPSNNKNNQAQQSNSDRFAKPSACETEQEKSSPNAKTAEDKPVLGSSLSDSLQMVCDELGQNADLYIRRLTLRNGSNAAIIYLDGLIECASLDQFILTPIMQSANEEPLLQIGNIENFKQRVVNELLPFHEITEAEDLQTVIKSILKGSTILLIDGSAGSIVLGTRSQITRALNEPLSEPLVRGPRIGFIESLRCNIAIIRDRTSDPKLTVNGFEIGVRSRKNAALFYIEDIANPELIEEVKQRIERIDVDDIPESGYMEQWIEDNYLSPFPQLQSTERPDRVVAALLEGRVAIMIEGSPFALIAPATFTMMLQTPDDYYERWMSGSLLRMLRYLAAFTTLFGPSLYIAFISFHPGLIPTRLVISMAGTREGVPFPPLVEALMMEIAIEILREAGLRLPKTVGQTVGLVGGLVVGQAAVEAHLISPIMVVVVALTAITSFILPQYSAGIALRMLRFIAMICASVLGLYGIILFFLFICAHAVKLHSFGIPYVTPAVPFRSRDWRDIIIRFPIFMMSRRPKMMRAQDDTRQQPSNTTSNKKR